MDEDTHLRRVDRCLGQDLADTVDDAEFGRVGRGEDLALQRRLLLSSTMSVKVPPMSAASLMSRFLPLRHYERGLQFCKKVSLFARRGSA